MRLWPRRRRAQSPVAADIDRLLMEAAAERARAMTQCEHALLPPVEALIASLTRLRMAVAEDRVPDVKLELAAIDAAHEQIKAIGRQRGAAA